MLCLTAGRKPTGSMFLVLENLRVGGAKNLTHFLWFCWETSDPDEMVQFYRTLKVLIQESLKDSFRCD